MRQNKVNPLSVEFLYELYYCVMKYDNVCSAVYYILISILI